MAKDRYAVTCNGRTAFYACMYEDIRQCAMDCGWAVALHGSLASDMDIMAMPWVDNAVSFKEMIDRVSKLFKDNDISSQYVITYNEKPHNRVVATVPIFADFYLDISTINTADVAPKSEADMLSHLLEDAWKRIEELDNLCGELQKAKTEVAMEIFEEIENRIGIGHDILDVWNILDELKKKYTEGNQGPEIKKCPDCKHFVGCECFDGKICDEFEEK